MATQGRFQGTRRRAKRNGVPKVGAVARMDAHVLGGFSVAVDGRSVAPPAWGRISAERLVKLLLVTRGHAMSREAVGEALWPEAAPDRQATNVRKALHFARRAFDGVSGGVPILSSERDRLSLAETVELDLDLDRLLDALTLFDERGRQPARIPVEGAIASILALGHEELLPADLYEEWLTALRDRLTRRWRDVALAECRRKLEAGDLGPCQALLERILLQDPADEDAHRLAIELFGRQGRHHAARRQFLHCRRELSNLGVEPSPETIAALGVAEVARGESGSLSQDASPPLVGRQAELDRLEALFDRVTAGRQASLVVQGPAGIGKSRLLEEVAVYARASEWQVLEARVAESSPALSFAPVGTALRGVLQRDTVQTWPEPAASAAATLVPSLGLDPAIHFKQPRALAAAVTELVRMLAVRRATVLTIDDAHWLHPGSADLLLTLARETADVPLLLSVGVRTNEPRARSTEGLVDGLHRQGAEVIEPLPLQRRYIPALVARHLGGTGVEPSLADVLFAQSAGNPLFCLEVARDAVDRDVIALAQGTWRATRPFESATVPRSVARLVHARCKRLDRTTVEILTLAAEAGEHVEYQLLARAATATPEALLGALDEALEAGLLHEVQGGYRFAHPLFRAALAAEVRRPRRAALLLSLARALAGDADPTKPEEIKAALASGTDPLAVGERALAAYDDGLEDAGGLAVAFGIAAGMRQAALFDREGARRTLERSLATWLRLPEIHQAAFEVSPAYRTLGDVLQTFGLDTEAVEAYRQSIGTSRRAEDTGAAYHALSFLPYRHGDYESTHGILDEGMAMAGDDELLLAVLMMESGWLKFRHQRLPEALAQLEEAEKVISARGSEVLRMQILDCLWGPLESLGRGDETTPGLLEALGIAIRVRDAVWEGRIRAHIGFRLVRAGTPGKARPHLERALKIASMVGDAYMEAVTTWAAAEMEYGLRNDLGAAALRDREIALLRGQGGNPRHEAMAHVHLALIHRRIGDRHSDLAEQRLARACARDPSVQDPAFVARVDEYLHSDVWVSMCQ